MGELEVPFQHLARLCLFDVLSTVLLLWLLSALIGFTRRFSATLFALSIGISVSITVDRFVGSWEGWENLWVAVISVLVLMVVLTLIRSRMMRRVGTERQPITLSVFISGWLVVLVVFVGLGYALLRGSPESIHFFSRLGFGDLVFVCVFALLIGRRGQRYRGRISLSAAVVLLVVGVSRTVYWRMLWSEEEGVTVRRERNDLGPGAMFPRLRVLLELRRAIALAEGDPSDAVDHLRRAASILHPRWWQRKLHKWTDEPVDFLLSAAFGTSVSLKDGEKAIEFCLDEAGRRFLVLTDQGKILSAGSGDGVLLELHFAPVGFCPIGRSGLAVLGKQGELAVISVSSATTRRSQLAGDYATVASAAGYLFFLRADGSVVRVRAGVTEEWLPWIWKNRAAAIDFALTEDGLGSYVLDAYGGVHPRGETAIKRADLKQHSRTVHYWPKRSMASAIQVTSHRFPLYGDIHGGLHAIRKENGELVYVGHERPLLDEPDAVDLIYCESFSAVYVLTSTGGIFVVPEYGWLSGEQVDLGG